MVKRTRERPARLAEKLLHIPQALGLSQSEMLRCIGKGKVVTVISSTITSAVCACPLYLELLAYARAAGMKVDVLIDDELDLPKRLPFKPKRK